MVCSLHVVDPFCRDASHRVGSDYCITYVVGGAKEAEGSVPFDRMTGGCVCEDGERMELAIHSIMDVM